MINLFLLPFAGGSKYSYYPLKTHFPAEVQFRPLDFPGRGARTHEPLLCSMKELVQDMHAQLHRFDLSGLPYALYGHSMGALVGYLLIHELRAAGMSLPTQFIVSGCDAPCYGPKRRGIHLMERREFVCEMKYYGGTPEDFFMDDALLNFYEPVLKADFQAYESFEYQKREPLPCPIMVIRGEEDLSNEEMRNSDWKRESTRQVLFKAMSGGHFFIFEQCQRVAQTIMDALFVV